jgi:hypothetical protein
MGNAPSKNTMNAIISAIADKDASKERAARLERECAADAARLERECAADAARLERERAADAARLERERDSNRLEAEIAAKWAGKLADKQHEVDVARGTVRARVRGVHQLHLYEGADPAARQGGQLCERH